MKNILTIILFTVVVTTPSAYIAFEDFQSYTDGDDIADVGPWTNWVPPNEVHCADLGGGVKVGVFHPAGGTDWGYVWDASDLTLNYGVSADVAYTSAAPDNIAAVLTMRVNGTYPTDFELYWLTFEPTLAPPLISLGYSSNTIGEEQLWSFEFSTPIPADEWHNILAYIHGEDPVTFQVYFDGQKIGSHVETNYLVPEGRAGISCHSVADTYDLMIGNVTQEDPNTAVAPSSLGLIKSTFR
jgi:hypothetical protein